jgi:uncharacterized protein (DUF924 family)
MTTLNTYINSEIKLIDSILDFWFEKKPNFEMWFENGTKYDNIITKKFKYFLIEAEKGNLLHWLSYHKSYLAYIILMDQFSRHIYRNTTKAYQNDKKVLLFTEMGFWLHCDKLDAIEKMFVLMPYQHSEDLKDQKLGKSILEKLIKSEKIFKEKNILKKALFHQNNHLKVIEKFGRFPKRNYILGRESTEEEIDYIDENDIYPY